MTAQESQYTDGAWYWVEKEGWIGDPPTIAPAKYKANCDAWYSFEFSGVPTREVKVLEPCTRDQPVARTPLSDEQLSKALEAGGVGTQTHTGILNRVSWTTCGSIDPRKICRAIEAAHGITQEKQ